MKRFLAIFLMSSALSGMEDSQWLCNVQSPDKIPVLKSEEEVNYKIWQSSFFGGASASLALLIYGGDKLKAYPFLGITIYYSIAGVATWFLHRSEKDGPYCPGYAYRQFQTARDRYNKNIVNVAALLSLSEISQNTIARTVCDKNTNTCVEEFYTEKFAEVTKKLNKSALAAVDLRKKIEYLDCAEKSGRSSDDFLRNLKQYRKKLCRTVAPRLLQLAYVIDSGYHDRYRAKLPIQDVLHSSYPYTRDTLCEEFGLEYPKRTILYGDDE